MALFPFSAIVGQDELKLALQMVVVDPSLGGVLVFGDRGTGKSTAVRALAGLLPRMAVVEGCPFQCNPDQDRSACPSVCQLASKERRGIEVPIPVVDLPIGATEDRVAGALDIEAALARGERAFAPGLLARANRGFLYIDEVNLLPDHLVDLLLDVAASGENVVERDGLSVRHPARFVLIGSGNPEEGELRPQLLDRFGLALEVRTPEDIPSRTEVVKRRMAFEHDPKAFIEKYASDERHVADVLRDARHRLRDVAIPDAIIERAALLCRSLGTDGLRGELTLIKAARSAASLSGRTAVTDVDLRQVAPLALRHRLRRSPLDEVGSTVRIEKVVAEVFGS